MPKEKINYSPVEKNTDGTLAVPATEASVYWSPTEHGNYVQLGFEFDITKMRDYLDSLATNSPDDSRATFYTPELTRAELQNLVRTTRRARNAVYGGDE